MGTVIPLCKELLWKAAAQGSKFIGKQKQRKKRISNISPNFHVLFPGAREIMGFMHKNVSASVSEAEVYSFTASTIFQWHETNA